LNFAVPLLLALLTAPASASDAVSRYQYEDGTVFTVRTGLGIATTIELDPNDPVLDFSSGFSSGWDIARRGTLFYIKPKNVDVDTNLLVRTQKRSYIFELSVVATDWRKLDDVRRRGVQYRVVFEYPQDIAAAAAALAAEAAAAQAAPAPIEPQSVIEAAPSFNYDYDVSTRTKRSWLVPSNVYDDGRFTYIRLSNPSNIPTGNWPTVFGRNSRHEEDFLLNSNVEGNTIVVHGIYPYLVLRHGEETVGLRRNPIE